LASFTQPQQRSRFIPMPGMAGRQVPVCVAVALLLVLVLPNPVGYVGGGGDDWYYVQAARCAAAQGWCLPETHWATRWPLIAPMGAVFALFGEGILQSMLIPFVYGLTAVILFVRLFGQAFDTHVALVAGIALVAVAAFAKILLQPNVDTVELTWLLAAATAGRAALRTGTVRYAVLAGLFFGIALQTRMTGLAWLPILLAGMFLVARDKRWLGLPALLGAAVPLALEAALYGYVTGDPMLSQHLSAAHTRLPSTELLATVDLARSPLFNPQFIGGWRPAMDIDLHWTVNGIVNLLANPAIGPVLVAALMLLWLHRGTISGRNPETLLAAAAALYTGTLIYALAIDPKPRMFLPVAAIAAAIIGLLAAKSWNRGERLLVAGILAALVLVASVETAKRFDMGKSAPLAAEWARAHPGDVAIDDNTRRFMPFDATLQKLPVFPAAVARRMLILIPGRCADAGSTLRTAPGNWQLVREADFGLPGDPLKLCEFARRDRAGPPHG
jgi:4-amino-4-deoxy-L-arabinose transferase-like glycosyltransferase